MWATESGVALATLWAHTGVVWCVALSADGRLVASGRADGTVGLWDTGSGVELRTLRTDRPYERMDITGLTGVTGAQKMALKAQGALETC